LFKPLNLDTPLDYTRYQPKRRPSGNYHITPFTLELFFDGREAALAGGSALCVGKLSIETQKDIRAFTSTKLSTGQTWIDAVGATLVTATGEGQIFARFRRFTISVYP
jgi:hypothetical protein